MLHVASRNVERVGVLQPMPRHRAHCLHGEPGRDQSVASEGAFQPSRRNSLGTISDMQESAM
jgi:hypothetical protein